MPLSSEMNAPHCPPDEPFPCFACKMAYWRATGVPAQYTYGRDVFHGPTTRELVEHDLKIHRENLGYEPIPHESNGSRWI